MVVLLSLLTFWLGLCNGSAFYDPGTQRWLNRDPIQEDGGMNLYELTKNDPINYVDIWGCDIDIYGGGTGNRNNPFPVQSPGKICGYINGKPIYCLPPKPSPKPPQKPPQPPKSNPSCPLTFDDPKHCWKSPDKALKGTETWQVACEMSYESCTACCAIDYGQSGPLQSCVDNCTAQRSACIFGGNAPPVAPTPPPSP